MPDGAELLTRFENLPFTRWHTRARIVVGSATFFDGFDSLSLAFALPVLIRLWKITPAESGLLISSSYVGQIFGALTFTWLAEKHGRIRSATAAVALMSVMSLGCALSTNFAMLFALRFVQGIGLGGEMPVAATYISEVSKARGRGRFFILYEMIFPIGLMAAGQIGALVVPIFGWQIMLLLGGVPGVVIAFLLTRLPESPRWLISQGRLAEAERIVKEVEAKAGAVPVVVLPTVTAAAAVERSRWTELLAGSYLHRTLIVWTLWFVSYFITNSLNNWMPSLYNTIYGLGLRESLRAASMTNVAKVLLLLVCAFFIDRAGRRNWTVACFVIGGLLLAVLGFAGARSVTSVMILATVSYGIVGSVNAVLYLYTPEIYPTRMRAIGTGLATSWLRLASAIGPSLVGVMVGSIGTGSVFIMFAAAAVVGAVAGLFMIETRARQLEEIAS